MPRVRRRRALYAWDCFQDDQPDAVAFDTETTGVAFHDTPFCVTMAWEHPEGYLDSHYIELDSKGRSVVAGILGTAPRLIGHNLKFDLQKCILAGVIERGELDGQRLEDTEALAHLVNEHQIKALKRLSETLLGESTDEDARLKVVRRKLKLTKAEGYHVLPRSVVVPYALKDAEFTYRLWKLLRPQVESYPELYSLYRLEMDLSLVLLDMETAGLQVNTDYAKKQLREHDDAIRGAEQNIASLVGREDFNPNSVPQIQEAFANRGVRLDDTKADTLAAVDDELAGAIVKLRKLNKTRSTYLLPLLKEQRRGILHPSFRQHGAKTGRMSSGANKG